MIQELIKKTKAWFSTPLDSPSEVKKEGTVTVYIDDRPKPEKMDVLVRSLERMKEDLAKKKLEDERKNWIRESEQARAILREKLEKQHAEAVEEAERTKWPIEGTVTVPNAPTLYELERTAHPQGALCLCDEDKRLYIRVRDDWSLVVNPLDEHKPKIPMVYHDIPLSKDQVAVLRDGKLVWRTLDQDITEEDLNSPVELPLIEIAYNLDTDLLTCPHCHSKEFNPECSFCGFG